MFFENKGKDDVGVTLLEELVDIEKEISKKVNWLIYSYERIRSRNLITSFDVDEPENSKNDFEDFDSIELEKRNLDDLVGRMSSCAKKIYATIPTNADIKENREVFERMMEELTYSKNRVVELVKKIEDMEWDRLEERTEDKIQLDYTQRLLKDTAAELEKTVALLEKTVTTVEQLREEVDQLKIKNEEKAVENISLTRVLHDVVVAFVLLFLFTMMLIFLSDHFQDSFGCRYEEKWEHANQECFPHPSEIVKPKLDDREYVFSKLENGLSLLTISHIGIETSAASLTVQVGSFKNPDDVLGLVHFLEHMLFMGTQKYPDERDFDDFIENNFGSKNGVTRLESTTYFFDITSSKFEDALDRFSQFFIEPLLLEDAIEREMKAVHSEYEKNVPIDAWKEFMIFKELSSPTGHPVSKFSTGNLDTLNISNIHERLVNFFDENYSSNLMYLVLYGNETTETLQGLGKKYFSEIKNHNVPETNLEDISFFHPPNMKQKIIHILPVKEKRRLSICFPVDGLVYGDYKNQTFEFLSQLFENKAERSLHDLLVKKKEWANSLSSGLDMRWEGQGMYCIELSLTIEGDRQENIDEIIKSVFEYYRFLQNVEVEEMTRLFEELKQISQHRFDFQPETRPSQICPSLSLSMTRTEPEDILKGIYYPYNFEYSRFLEDLDKIFNPEKLFVFWTSKNHEASENAEGWKIEKYLYGKYRTKSISEEVIEIISSSSSSSSIFDFEVPPINEYIPQRLDLVQFVDDNERNMNILPRRVYNDDFPEDKVTFFFKQDTQFQRPKSTIIIRLHVPEISVSSKSWILASLYSELVGDYLSKFTHPASVAGLSCSFGVNDRVIVGTTEDVGFEMIIFGWSDSVLKLLRLYLRTLTQRNLMDAYRERFEIFKDEKVKNYGNFELIQPYRYGMYVARFCLIHSPRVFFHDVMHEVSKDVRFEDLEETISRISASRITVLAMGNHKQDEIINEVLNDELLLQILEKDEEETKIEKTRIVKLEERKRYILSIPYKNPNDTTNNCLVMNFQIGTWSRRLDMITSILEAIMSPIVFDSLRTKEQLGYLVHFHFTRIHNVYYGQFIIQSSHDPIELSEKVDAFIKNTLSEEVSMKISGEKLGELKQQLIQKYEDTKPKTLFEESSLAWREISNKQFRFDRYGENIKKLLEEEDDEYISVDDILEFFHNTFLGDSKSVFEVRLFSEGNWKLFEQGEIGMNVEDKDVMFFEDVEFLRSAELDSYPNFVLY